MFSALPAALAQEDPESGDRSPVVIYSQPSSAKVILGGWNAVFSVTADGAEQYQWQVEKDDGWKDIAGQTKARLVRSAVKENNGKRFRCALTGPDGEICYTSAAEMRVASEGGIVQFGRYEQDNKKNNGLEPIEWQVLKIRKSKALLISRYALDAQPFHKTQKTNKWEKCSLRTWLNSTFYQTAFSDDEQEAILTTKVDNGKGQVKWKIAGGKDTSDKIFLLSETEAYQYFRSGNARLCKATAYAQARGAHIYNGVCDSWWLRSPANTGFRACTIYEDGGGMVMFPVDDKGVGVRPALWVDLNAELD